MCTAPATDSATWLSYLAPLGSFMLGSVTAVFAEPVRQFIFRPKVELGFSNKDDCITKTPTTGGHNAIYVRVKVTNTKPRLARQCRAYLVNIELQNQNGSFVPTIYSDSIQLAWSCRDKGLDPLDLPRGVSQYIDVVATDEASNDYSPQIAPFPLRYKSLFDPAPKTLRFTIQVAGDNVSPRFTQVVFVWKGRWDTIEAHG